MTATDELRRLLDGRGVEWRDDSSIYGTRRTVWTVDGVTYVAAEVSGRLKVSGYLTPAQAVDATLGRGTCHMEYRDEWSGDELYPTEAYMCSACKYITVDGKPNYCPNCGRKVVDA